MGAGDDAAVATEQVHPFALEVMVGGDVDLEALAAAPVDQVQVGRVLPHRAELVLRTRLKAEQRPLPGRVLHTLAVEVLVVTGEPVFPTPAFNSKSMSSNTVRCPLAS